MLRRIACLILIAATTTPLGGCLVAESTYLKKVAETDGLTREYGELKQKHEALTVENATLKSELADRVKEQGELEQVLKAKSDTLSQNISELRQKIADLEAENRELARNREEKVKEVSAIYEKLLQELKNEIAQGEVTISELKGKLSITLEAALLFEPGRADVRSDGLVILQKVAGTLKDVRDRAIRVEGHTDNAAITGSQARTYPTNWEFSAARAVSVARYLQRQGVDPALLSADAYGEHRPVADNSTKEGRSRNRRIEISLVAK